MNRKGEKAFSQLKYQLLQKVENSFWLIYFLSEGE
jgi:hypothetical protein